MCTIAIVPIVENRRQFDISRFMYWFILQNGLGHCFFPILFFWLLTLSTIIFPLFVFSFEVKWLWMFLNFCITENVHYFTMMDFLVANLGTFSSFLSPSIIKSKCSSPPFFFFSDFDVKFTFISPLFFFYKSAINISTLNTFSFSVMSSSNISKSKVVSLENINVNDFLNFISCPVSVSVLAVHPPTRPTTKLSD